MKIITKDGIPVGVEPETPEEQERFNAGIVAVSDFKQWLRDKIAADTSGPN